jgi:hypothetical protein
MAENASHEFPALPMVIGDDKSVCGVDATLKLLAIATT